MHPPSYAAEPTALQGVSTDEQPTPAQLKKMVNAIQSAQVPTVFAEASVNPALIKTVAEDAQVKLAEQPLFADGLGEADSGATTDQQMLIKNTQTIVGGLGGKTAPPPHNSQINE